MFYYLDGMIDLPEAGIAVVDCGGVGYKCNITLNTRSYLRAGEKARLFTMCHIREDCFDIYGFYSKAEKNAFEMLIGVSGVGPKAALSILSANTPEAFAMAVITGNEKALTLAAGIGKKTAQRIILELKDKMAKETSDFAPSTLASADVDRTSNSKEADAAAALAVLGYSSGDIAAVLKKIDVKSLSLEEIVRSALKSMLK